MRYLVALLATTAPALAHPGHGAALHLHEKDGFLIAGIAFVSDGSALLALGLGLLGLDFLTAVSSAATAISNVGPALGPIVGPSGTFQELPDAAKWLLAGGMLLGRLELFTVIVLFSRSFWRD